MPSQHYRSIWGNFCLINYALSITMRWWRRRWKLGGIEWLLHEYCFVLTAANTVSFLYFVHCVSTWNVRVCLLADFISVRMCAYSQRSTVMAALWVTRSVSRTRSSSQSFTCYCVASLDSYRCEYVKQLCVIVCKRVWEVWINSCRV